MLIPPEIVYDLKTERSDVLPPLPMTMRLIPIVFYLAAFAAIVLVSLTLLQMRQTIAELEATRSRTVVAAKMLEEAASDRTALESRAKRASDLLQWVEGAVSLQPLVVGMARSLSARAAITELALARESDTTRQIQLSLKLQGADPNQLEQTIEAIRAASYRPFSARQAQQGNRIDYEASLIYQLPDAMPEPPGTGGPGGEEQEGEG